MTADATPRDAAAPPVRPAAPRLRRLWAEFTALYVAIPLVLAFLLPPDMMWPVLAGCLVASVALLQITPGFRWSELLRGPLLSRPAALAAFAGLCLGASTMLTLWLRPRALFFLPRDLPQLWLAIMLLYPVLSALPQEVAFRVLFFRRYGALFPSRAAAIAVNGLVFGLAHLFLWNWVAPPLAALGGAVFAWAYLDGRSRNFLLPLLLHIIGGWIIFTTGLGLYFYHGAIR